MKTDFTTDYFNYEDSLNVIRWLEIIEYKFHILDFRRKFRRKKSEEYIPLLRDIPMTVMRPEIGYSPYKAMAQLRLAQSRIQRKEKDSRYYSLVLFKNKNKQSFFFHKMDEYIFFEFPQFKKAIFYFFKGDYKSNYKAAGKAKILIKHNYE